MVGFWGGAACCIAALVLFYSRERSLLHRDVTERFFWAIMWGWCTYLLLLPDSPLHTLRPRRYEALERFLLVLMSSALGMRAQARDHSKRLRSRIQRLDLRQLARQYTETLAVRVSICRLVRCLEAKRPRSILDIRGFARHVKGAPPIEHEVYRALSDCCAAGPEQLLYALNSADVELPRLFAVAGSGKVLHLLHQQIPYMDVVTKARIVDSLQRQSEFWCRHALQELAAELLIQTPAAEMTTLKSLLDEGGDFYNLHKLVFTDLGEDLRLRVLERLADASRELRDVYDELDDCVTQPTQPTELGERPRQLNGVGSDAGHPVSLPSCIKGRSRVASDDCGSPSSATSAKGRPKLSWDDCEPLRPLASPKSSPSSSPLAATRKPGRLRGVGLDLASLVGRSGPAIPSSSPLGGSYEDPDDCPSPTASTGQASSTSFRCPGRRPAASFDCPSPTGSVSRPRGQRGSSLDEWFIGSVASASQLRRQRGSGACLVRKILSDIDDTLYSSGGHFPAGADHRYPKGELYPGVLALFRELDAALDESRAAELTNPKLSGCATPCWQRGVTPNYGAVSPTWGRTISQDTSHWGRKDSWRQRSVRGFEAFRHALSRTLFRRGASESDSDAFWLRMSAVEWMELSVPGTETVNTLKTLIKETRQANNLSSSTPARGASEHLADISFSPPSRREMSNLVFLSARPHAYKDFTESKSYRLFKQLRARGVLHCMPTLLAGRMRASAGAALRGMLIEFRQAFALALLGALVLAAFLFAFRSGAMSLWHPIGWLVLVGAFAYGVELNLSGENSSWVWQPVGEEKVRSFVEYQSLYGECTSVFFGDNGQGDLWCAEQLGLLSLEADADSPAVEACFIHEVIPREKQLSSLPQEWSNEEKEMEWRRRGVFFHRTYLGAAINAFDCGLISGEALSRVGTAAVEEMLRMWVAYSDSPHAWTTRGWELNEDVLKANLKLPYGVTPIAMVPSSFGSKTDLEMAMSERASVGDFAFLTPAPRSEWSGASPMPSPRAW